MSESEKYVYVMESKWTGLRKIGYSRDPGERERSIKFPGMRTIYSRQVDDAYALEQAVHAALADNCVERTEWFDIDAATAIEAVRSIDYTPRPAKLITPAEESVEGLIRSLIARSPETVRSAVAYADMAEARERAYAELRDPTSQAYVEMREAKERAFVEARASRGSGVSMSPRVELRESISVRPLSRIEIGPAVSEQDARAGRLSGTLRETADKLHEFLWEGNDTRISPAAMSKVVLDLAETREKLDSIAALFADGVIAV